MRIGELAGLVGISTRAIRHYHRIGLLGEPARKANGYRQRRTRLAQLLRQAEAGSELSEQAPVSPGLAELFDRMAHVASGKPGPESAMAAKDRDRDGGARLHHPLARRPRDRARPRLVGGVLHHRPGDHRRLRRTPLHARQAGSVGRRKPRPAWVYAEDTFEQVARWMRDCHQAVADFVPPPGAVWRGGDTWSPGLIIVHNDVTIHNAAWCQGRLTGFFDWDFAGPAMPEWDLALAAFSWVPLHARWFAAAEGFTDFAGRPRRLGRFLGVYGWPGTAAEFLGVVQARVTAHAGGIRGNAATGDEASGRLLRQGVPDALDQAIAELASFPR
jgi:hypothetical protein